MKTYVATCMGLAPARGKIWLVDAQGQSFEVVAGREVQAQAEALRGRKVRFQAFLSEETVTLASPIFVVGSQMGLQAVAELRAAEAAE